MGIREVSAWGLCVLLALVCGFLARRVITRKPLSSAAQESPWPLANICDSRHRTTIVIADVNYGMLRIISQKPGSLEERLGPDFPNGFAPASTSV